MLLAAKGIVAGARTDKNAALFVLFLDYQILHYLDLGFFFHT